MGPVFSFRIHLSDVAPATVKRECTSLPGGVLDVNNPRRLISGVLDNVEPVVCSVIACAFELRAREPDWAVIEAVGHRFDFTPAHWIAVEPIFEQVKAMIVSGSPLPVRKSTQDEIDGFLFQSHTSRVLQTIRVGLIIVVMDSHIGDE